MSGAGGLADSVEDRRVRRNSETDRRDTRKGFSLCVVRDTKRRIDLDRLSGKESREMGERRIGVGSRPTLLALMPPATLNGLDLGDMVDGIRHTYDESSRTTWFDLNRVL